jgi:hypothetical protein
MDNEEIANKPAVYKATLSFNFVFNGFPTSLVIEDNSSTLLLDEYQALLVRLLDMGAAPVPKEETPKATPKSDTPDNLNPPRVCQFCGSANVRYIAARKDGSPVKNWVCDDCNRWQRKGNSQK